MAKKKKKAKPSKADALRKRKNDGLLLTIKEIQASPGLSKIPLEDAMQIVFETTLTRIMPQYYNRLVDAGLAVPETAFDNLDTIDMTGNGMLRSLSDPDTGPDTEKSAVLRALLRKAGKISIHAFEERVDQAHAAVREHGRGEIQAGITDPPPPVQEHAHQQAAQDAAPPDVLD